MAWLLEFSYSGAGCRQENFVGLYNIFAEHLFELCIDKSRSHIITILTLKGVFYGNPKTD